MSTPNRECSATMPGSQRHCAKRHSAWDRKRFYQKSTMYLQAWPDSSHQRVHLFVHEMVYLDRDPAAASLIHESCGFFDRLRSVHFRSLRPACSTRDVDG